MARKGSKIRYLNEMSSISELRLVRREVDMKLWYTEEKLANDIDELFSVDNLLSIIAPPGSIAQRLVDGVGTWLATLRGIINGIALFRERHR